MSSPRSTVLGRGSISVAGQYVVVQAPAGHTLIAKDLRLYNKGSASTNVYVYLGKSGVTAAPFIAQITLAAGAVYASSLYIVLDEGSYAIIGSSASILDYWISGTVLTGVAAYTPPPSPQALPG